TATGLSALRNNTSGNSNTADGTNALFNNTIGSLNVALGDRAGLNLTTGSNNIVIGAGVLGVAGDANTIRIGNAGIQTSTYIAGIRGAVVASGATVMVGNDGRLGTIVSSARFKDEIQPMDRSSEALFSLRPVIFRYKPEIDPAGTLQFGLVAEEVETVNPDLVVTDQKGKPYSVRYDQVNVMLLNEFLKEHKRVQEHSATIAELKSIVAQQRKAFED